MVTEQDIELLELYSDGELDAAEQAEVERRLENEAGLCDELKRLRSQRDQRMQLWKSLEVSDEAATGRILEALAGKRQRRSWFMAILDHRERIAAAAACIAVFMMGWQWGRNSDAYRMRPAAQAAQPVSLITQQQVPAGSTTVFEVRVTGANGDVLRVERFATLEEAQKFIQQMQLQLQR